MKLNSKYIDFTYTSGEEIFNFPEGSGHPFIFDIEEELTGDPAAIDAVGEMLDEAKKLAEKAQAAILELKRFGSLEDDELDQLVFSMDLSFNSEITDVLIDLNQRILCITYES